MDEQAIRRVEDVEVFRRAYRLSLGGSSGQPGVPADRAMGAGRSGQAVLQIDLREARRGVSPSRVILRRSIGATC